jgi:hypothetical protein
MQHNPNIPRIVQVPPEQIPTPPPTAVTVTLSYAVSSTTSTSPPLLTAMWVEKYCPTSAPYLMEPLSKDRIRVGSSEHHRQSCHASSHERAQHWSGRVCRAMHRGPAQLSTVHTKLGHACCVGRLGQATSTT